MNWTPPKNSFWKIEPRGSIGADTVGQKGEHRFIGRWLVLVSTKTKNIQNLTFIGLWLVLVATKYKEKQNRTFIGQEF